MDAQNLSTWPMLPPVTPPPPLTNSKHLVLQPPDLDHIESVDMYKPGGHHPVNLGDVLGERFKIIHKLGNGGFALVWLARDLEQGQYVALKTLKADAPHHEVEILEHIRAKSASHFRIAKLRETFTIRGPNGTHLCLVMDVGGPSLKHLSLRHKRPDLSFLKRASQTLARGLGELHSIGVCHGDLTDTNILFEINNLHQWSECQVYQCFVSPKTAALFLLDGSPAPPFAPKHVVNAPDFSGLGIDQLSSNVLIVDFGEAFFEKELPRNLGTPASFYAPEMLFGYQPSSAADLWAVGCLIFEMHTFRMLLPTAFGSTLEALCLAVETIGVLPKEWSDRYRNMCDSTLMAVDADHQWFDTSIQRTRVLESQILNLMQDVSREKLAVFVGLLKGILAFEPTSRLSAEAIGEHPWFMEK